MPYESLIKLSQPEFYQKLKKTIFDYHHDRKSVTDLIQEGSETSGTILSGIQHFFQVFASTLAAMGHSIPYVGGILALLSLVPKSIAILLDKKKSVKEKVISAVLLTILFGLVLTATVLGASSAVLIGAVASGVVVIFEGVGLVGKLLVRNKLNQQISLHQRFEDGIKKGNLSLESNEFDELIALAFTQSSYKVTHGKEKDQSSIYLEQLMKQKGIDLNQFESVKRLVELYSIKDELMGNLKAKFIALEEQKSKEEKENTLREIHEIKLELYKNKQDISEYTHNSNALMMERSKLNDQIALSKASIGVAGAGCLLSVAAFLLISGIIAAPPVAITVVLSLAVVVVVAGLLKFAAEKFIEYDHKKMDLAKQAKDEDRLLEQALYRYGKEKQEKITPRASSQPIPIPGPQIERQDTLSSELDSSFDLSLLDEEDDELLVPLEEESDNRTQFTFD
ncbi:T4SS effector SidA family protein [Legionella waltersii]|uniref:SidA protein, subsrate of the Dot/Icm transport system n=1 Tax=Legionella waltersii TaxID=66969 RepID=A0A0W1A1M5_9GAMM|nr:T4SS effector SidA family protein [Legionella waltersii]KTD75271.1 SidA protein, subsrate of the Dot/Icm transport system [Legionella waltersii]SNV06837.1 SidA [Legionella waltersii]